MAHQITGRDLLFAGPSIQALWRNLYPNAGFENAEAVLEAYSAGQRDFGENFVQEGLEKIAQVGVQIRFTSGLNPAICSS